MLSKILNFMGESNNIFIERFILNFSVKIHKGASDEI